MKLNLILPFHNSADMDDLCESCCHGQPLVYRQERPLRTRRPTRFSPMYPRRRPWARTRTSWLVPASLFGLIDSEDEEVDQLEDCLGDIFTLLSEDNAKCSRVKTAGTNKSDRNSKTSGNDGINGTRFAETASGEQAEAHPEYMVTDTNGTANQVEPSGLLQEKPYERVVTIARPQQSEKFAVKVNISSYRPDDVTVKVKDQVVTVDARRRDVDKNTGFHIHRELHRRYTLPKSVNPDRIISVLDANGVLTIKESENRIPVQEPQKTIAESTEGKLDPTPDEQQGSNDQQEDNNTVN